MLQRWKVPQKQVKKRRLGTGDNGPEFVASAIREWLSISGVRTLYVEPGSPWQNRFVERFRARLRDRYPEQVNQEGVLLREPKWDVGRRRMIVRRVAEPKRLPAA